MDTFTTGIDKSNQMTESGNLHASSPASSCVQPHGVQLGPCIDTLHQAKTLRGSAWNVALHRHLYVTPIESSIVFVFRHSKASGLRGVLTSRVHVRLEEE